MSAIKIMEDNLLFKAGKGGGSLLLMSLRDMMSIDRHGNTGLLGQK